MKKVMDFLKANWKRVLGFVAIMIIGALMVIAPFNQFKDYFSSNVEKLDITGIANPAVIPDAFESIETSESLAFRKTLSRKILENRELRGMIDSAIVSIKTEKGFCKKKSETLRKARSVLDSSSSKNFKNRSGDVYSRGDVERLIDEDCLEIALAQDRIARYRNLILRYQVKVKVNSTEISRIGKGLEAVFINQSRRYMNEKK